MREKDERKKAGVTSTTPARHTQRNFFLLPLQPGGVEVLTGSVEVKQQANAALGRP